MELGGKIKQFIMRFWRGTALPTAAELVAVVACPTTNPWLGAIAATTPIVGNNGASAARIRCILRDGNGQPISQGILKVYVAARFGAVASAIQGGIGTVLSEINGSNDAFNAPIGGMICVQANTSGAIDLLLGAFSGGPGAYTVVLEHLGHPVACSVTVAA